MDFSHTNRISLMTLLKGDDRYGQGTKKFSFIHNLIHQTDDTFFAAVPEAKAEGSHETEIPISPTT